jgi:hypothetical protein
MRRGATGVPGRVMENEHRRFEIVLATKISIRQRKGRGIAALLI